MKKISYKYITIDEEDMTDEEVRIGKQYEQMRTRVSKMKKSERLIKDPSCMQVGSFYRFVDDVDSDADEDTPPNPTGPVLKCTDLGNNKVTFNYKDSLPLDSGITHFYEVYPTDPPILDSTSGGGRNKRKKSGARKTSKNAKIVRKNKQKTKRNRH